MKKRLFLSVKIFTAAALVFALAGCNNTTVTTPTVTTPLSETTFSTITSSKLNAEQTTTTAAITTSASYPTQTTTTSTPLTTAATQQTTKPSTSVSFAAAGLYAIWYSNHPDVVDLPYISGGQIVLQWGDLEKSEGQYDFSSLDQQLQNYAKINFKTTVQVNGEKKPAWLFQKVPYNPSKLTVQIADPLGTLMYWHPAYIKAYTDFLKALAQHLKSSPYLQNVVGIRQNFDALATEELTIPAANQALSQWITPAGVTQGQVWTQAIADNYQSTVLETFVDYFSGWVYVFIRNTISDSLISKYLPLFESGKLGWFQTGSEVEPRGGSGEAAVSRYYDYCLTGETIGYAEPMADAWGFHGDTQDAHWASPPQWNYWRLLNDLNAGVSMIAIYGNDLNVALTGKYAGQTVPASYQQEFNQAFQFAAKYAGFITQPQVSPGAWIAFRHSDFNILQKNSLQAKGYANAAQTAALTQYTDDYTFLIKRLPDNTTVQTNVGPDDQRYGAWARLLPAGQSMKLVLDDTFAQSLEGKPSEIHVTYLDGAAGSFLTTINGQTFKTELKGTGLWQTASFSIAQTHLVKDSSGAEITIQSSGADVFFHMLEIVRASN